jgi:hypothetical protein
MIGSIEASCALQATDISAQIGQMNSADWEHHSAIFQSKLSSLKVFIKVLSTWRREAKLPRA